MNISELQEEFLSSTYSYNMALRISFSAKRISRCSSSLTNTFDLLFSHTKFGFCFCGKTSYFAGKISMISVSFLDTIVVIGVEMVGTGVFGVGGGGGLSLGLSALFPRLNECKVFNGRV